MMTPKAVASIAINSAVDRLGSIEAVLKEKIDYDAIFPFLYYKLLEKRAANDVFGMAKYMLLIREQDIQVAKRPEYVGIIDLFRECNNMLKKHGLMLIPEKGEEG